MALGEALLEEGGSPKPCRSCHRPDRAARTGGAVPLTVGALLLARPRRERAARRSFAAAARDLGDPHRLWRRAFSTALVLQRIGLVHMWAGRYDEASPGCARWPAATTCASRPSARSSTAPPPRWCSSISSADAGRGAGTGGGPARGDADLPVEQRTRALRINTELVWVRVLLASGAATKSDPRWRPWRRSAASCTRGRPWG